MDPHSPADLYDSVQLDSISSAQRFVDTINSSELGALVNDLRFAFIQEESKDPKPVDGALGEVYAPVELVGTRRIWSRLVNVQQVTFIDAPAAFTSFLDAAKNGVVFDSL